MAEAQDVDTLKRRGRRRLVGAVALVLLAVIVLPMVFDPEPREAAPPVSVRIPGENETAFTPKPKPAPGKKHVSEKEFVVQVGDRKSTRLNSSHGYISYAVFCLKKKKKEELRIR